MSDAGVSMDGTAVVVVDAGASQEPPAPAVSDEPVDGVGEETTPMVTVDLDDSGTLMSPTGASQGQTSEQCAFSVRVCRRRRLSGFAFCSEHVLEDEHAPYIQCEYAIQSGKQMRCLVPVHAGSVHKYCVRHRVALGLLKRRLTRDEGEEYVGPRRKLLNALRKQGIPATTNDTQPITDEVGETFDDVESVDGRSDYEVSESDTEAEILPPVDEEMLSDNECLRDASVLTDEELLRIRRERVLRLSQIYRAQFQRLKALLRAKIKATVTGAPRKNPGARGDSERSSTLHHYYKRPGEELLLQHRKRVRLNSGAAAPADTCQFSDDDETCRAPAFPLSSYCYKHILNDEAQQLFVACVHIEDDERCAVPVVKHRTPALCEEHAPVGAALGIGSPTVQPSVAVRVAHMDFESVSGSPPRGRPIEVAVDDDSEDVSLEGSPAPMDVAISTPMTPAKNVETAAPFL